MLSVRENKKRKQKKYNLVVLYLGKIKMYHPLLHQAYRAITCRTVHLLQLVLIGVHRAVRCTKLKRKETNKILSAN
jgi:hypothetical protein